jgi:hypothetical protein
MTEGELFIGAATLALGAATVWLGLETRWTRNEGRKDVARALLRAALAEQLGNCRDWLIRDPARGEPAIRGLEGSEPRLRAVQALIDGLDLQADLVAYLIWLLPTIGDLWGRIDQLIDRAPDDWGKPDGIRSLEPQELSELGDLWRAMVERVQVLAALMAGEARRREFLDVASPHDAAPWTVVPQRPERWREYIAISGIQRGEPRFPADSAFAAIRPEARDRAGAATGAAQIGPVKRSTASSSTRVR